MQEFLFMKSSKNGGPKVNILYESFLDINVKKLLQTKLQETLLGFFFCIEQILKQEKKLLKFPMLDVFQERAF